MASDEKNDPSWARRNRYGVLTFTLLATIGATAFVEESSWFGIVVHISYLVMMASALYSFSKRRALFITGLALGVTTELTLTAGQVGAIDELLIAGLALRVAFLSLATAAVFTDILRSHEVTMNAVFGACTVYLLLALSFGAIFGLIEQLDPGSFNITRIELGTPEKRFEPMNDSAVLTYYSMITLTTVGYGDVTPLSPAARIMSALEGIFGQLFIAVVLARFVAMELAQRLQRGTRSSGE